jgi:hypothetical protein
MSWHDCHVNAIALDQNGEWQSNLVFDLDFIVEWLCGTDKKYRFRVAPAVLRFVGVDNLKLDVSLKFKQPLDNQGTESSGLEREPHRVRRDRLHSGVDRQRYRNGSAKSGGISAQAGERRMANKHLNGTASAPVRRGVRPLFST